jgi:phosphatidylinositol alpha 1,6-mannosyltransferase
MKNLRIIIVTGNYNHVPDGVSLTLNRLVRFLESVGTKVLIIAPTIDNPPIDHAGRLVAVDSLSMPGREEYQISLGLSERVKQEIIRFRPDLVHIATPDLAGWRALLFAKEYGFQWCHPITPILQAIWNIIN